MKKFFYLGAVLMTSLLVSSCEKNELAPAPEQATVNVRICIADDADAVLKSGFDGEKVCLSGSENMSLFYHNGEKFVGTTPTNPYLAKGAAGEYTFACPADAVENTWFPILPYSQAIVRLNSSGSSAYVRLSQVQFPSANSFDPQMDYLIGKPFVFTPDGDSYKAEVKEVKRLFTPFKLNLKGLGAEDKIAAVTVSFAKAIAGNTKVVADALTGTYYVALSEEFNSAKLTTLQENSASNAVTAVYTEPLVANGGVYPVWFIVNAVSYAAGTDMTVTVTTQDKIYEKTVSLSADTEIALDRINTIGLTLSSDDIKETEVSTTVFSQMTKAGQVELVDAAGNSYVWNTDASIYKTPEGTTIPVALQVNDTKSLTFPNPSTKNIKKAILYTNALNVAAGSNATANYHAFNLEDGGDYGYNLYNLAESNMGPASTLGANGGRLELAILDGFLGGKVLSSYTKGGNKMISAVTLILEDKPAGEVDYNDYYDVFTKTGKILINGEEYSSATYTAVLKKVSECTNQSALMVDDNTIVFLEAEDGQAVDFTSNFTISKNVIVVGRHRDAQPVLNMAYDMGSGKYSQFQVKKNLTLKNVKILSSNVTNLIQTGQLADGDADPTVIVEDCDITAAGSFCYDNNKIVALGKFIANNNIFRYEGTSTAHIYRVCTDAAFKQNRTTSLVSFNNNVIYCVDNSKARQLANITYGDYPDMQINITNNTFVNLYNSSMIQFQPPVKGINVENNIFYCDSKSFTKAQGLYICAAKESNGAVEVWFTGAVNVSKCYGVNVFTTYAANWNAFNSAMQGKGATKSSNTFINDAAAELPVNLATGIQGYYPATSVASTKGVTGADYTTKYWMHSALAK